MSTETDLLRAIRDNPDEDTPRLMFADHLDEEGNAPRAEFIRVQVERARLSDHDPARRALEDREHELLAEHECSWLGVAPDDMDELTEWEFDRGFVNEVAASPVFMNGPGSDLCAAHPVRRWRVMSAQNNLPADLRECGQRGWCDRLEALDLSGWYAGLGEVSGFLTRSYFARLRELDLRMCGPLESLPELLEVVPFRDNLTALRCGANAADGAGLDVAEFVRALGTKCALSELCIMSSMLNDADIGDLLGSTAAARLTSLDLQQNIPDVGSVAAFHATRARFRELDISETILGTSLALLLWCRSLADLTELYVNSAGHTADNVRALAASRFWSRATALWMRRGTFDYDGDDEVPEGTGEVLDPLFAATGSSNLRTLDLAGYALRDTGVARLCAAPWAGSLTYLDLSQNHLSDEALRELARSGRFKCLRTLHLNGNSVYQQANATESITDAGLRALADCPDLANLRVLSLSGTRITADGIDAILNSPHFRLTGLRLANCQLRGNAIEVLASSPRTSRLEVLDLSSNDEIGSNHLMALAESEYLSPLTELDIRATADAGTTVRTALRERLGRRLSE